jgi:tetratricopeptide (TPR) repeat protein
MNVEELEALISQGEGPGVEFKRLDEKSDQGQKLAKTMAAFANSGGGVLLLGVNDRGIIEGIDDKLSKPGESKSNKEMDKLTALARNLNPPLRPEIGRVRVGEDLYVVYARVAEAKPCSYMNRFYIRVGATSQEASHEEVASLVGAGQPPRPQASQIPPVTFSPPPTRSFKGRTRELTRLTDLLNNPAVSMVVIEGISGIGKTALCARFAGELVRHEYLPFWFDCRDDTSFDSVSSALAAFARFNADDPLADCLEDVTVSLEDRLARIAAVAGGRRYALFLDDYHLVADVLVNRALHKWGERARDLKIFLICRQRPRLASSVSPALLKEERLRDGLDLAACSDFLAECDLRLPAETVERIWRLTGEGHPKALEIFIARSRSYPLSDLLSSLPTFREELISEWLSPLMGELPTEQKEVALDLSVFDRPVPLGRVDLLFPERTIGPAVNGLVDRFILDRVSDEHLKMHLLVRNYCYDLLPDKRSKHLWAAEFYLAQTELDFDREVMGEDQLDAHIAAWSHFVKAGEYGRATEELNMIRPHLMNRGQYEQAMFLIEHTPLPPEDEDWYAIHKARILSLWGDVDAALKYLTPLITSPDPGVAREAILVLAMVYNDHGEGRRAKGLLESHPQLFLKNASSRIRRRFISRLIETHTNLGDYEKASEWAGKLLEISEAENDEISAAVTLRQIAAIMRNQKKTDTGLTLAQSSYNLFLKNGRLREGSVTQILIAAVYQDMKKITAATETLHSALQFFVKMGDRKYMTLCKQRLRELREEIVHHGPDQPPGFVAL